MVATSPLLDADAATKGASGGPREVDTSTRPTSVWWGRCRWHVLIYLVLLGALLAGTNLRASWAYDDGAYAIQVKVIEQTGHWSYPYRNLDIDSHVEHAPVDHAVVTSEGKLYPYVKQPAWIEVLRLSTAVFGIPLGLYVPSALGAVAAAAVAWFLARRFDPATAPWAFWAVALGPLLIHATAMWAHTTGAALGGLAALLVLDAADGRLGWKRSIALAVTLAAIVCLRDEGVLLVAAVLPVMALLAARAGDDLVGRARSVATACAPAGVAGVAAYEASKAWGHAIAPGSWGGPAEFAYQTSFIQGRIMGATRTLLNGWGHSSSGTMLALVATVLFAAGGWLLGQRRDARAGCLALAGGLLLLVVRTLLVAPVDLAGYAAASPLVVVAIAAAPWRSIGRRGLSLAVIAGLYLLGVLATEYPEGGSRDWGGRYLFLVLVPVAVGSVVVARRAWSAIGDLETKRRAAIVLAALVVVPALLGIYATEGLRNANGAMTVQAQSTGAPVVIRTNRSLLRLSWNVLPQSDWLTADPAGVPALLASLRRVHAGSVAVSGYGAEQVHAAGYRREVRGAGLVVFVPT